MAPDTTKDRDGKSRSTGLAGVLLACCAGWSACVPPTSDTPSSGTENKPEAPPVPALPEVAEPAAPAPEVADAAPAKPQTISPSPPRRKGLDCTRIEEDGYRRGVQFPITVVMIDGRRVEEHTADAYMAMAAAARKDGIELGIHSGFRSMAEQVYFYDCYTTCSCNDCAKAAKPGRSNHQSGRALDLALNPGTVEWLKRHARTFGFKNTVRSEPWHWEYRRRRKHRFPKACPKPDKP